jgi:hypothetical protein
MKSPAAESQGIKINSQRPIASAFQSAFQIWRNGTRICARFLWFFFSLLIAMLPFDLLIAWLNPEGMSLFMNGKIRGPGVFTLAALVVYLPFACALASRFSVRTFGERS